jgi:hypothetical protein
MNKNTNKTAVKTGLESQLKAIVPGKTYPTFVEVTEPDGTVITFNLNSFMVGMYCAININGKLAHQGGDHNNKGFCLKLKKDIAKAIARGSKVEISGIQPIKTF